MNENRTDRLYELLPSIYRMRDEEQGSPLRALLRVIAEQVNLLENNIQQLYENWFIETCEDWVVPYLGDLVGYEPVHEAGEPSGVDTVQGRQRNKILIPRREIANTIRYRRRKGTLALLELLANDIADWPARAVEFCRLLGWTQSVKNPHSEQGQTVDVRNGAALDLLDSPFDTLAHTVDVRRINSQRSQGRYNIPSVGVFVWRLKSYSVTQTPAYCLEAVGPHCFTFSVLGNDTPLYMRPEPESDPIHIADEFNLPVPIRRRLFEKELTRLYGKSLHIAICRKRGRNIISEPVPPEQVIPADLSSWQCVPPNGKVAVDPILGRIAFPIRQFPKHGVQVSYQYGFSMNIGGGEYERATSQPEGAKIYNVSKDGAYASINAAFEQWKKDARQDGKLSHAVIEIADSNIYAEPIAIEFWKKDASLQLRAASACRPVIRLLDWNASQSDSLMVVGAEGCRFTLDGILIAGRGMQIDGDLEELNIRHSTLVPGWSLNSDSEPQRAFEPSLEVFSPKVRINIEHSILGTIQANPILSDAASWDEKKKPNGSDNTVIQIGCQNNGGEVQLAPIRISVQDSIIDATDPNMEALGAKGYPVTYAALRVVRSTIIGQVHAHAVELGENSIFYGLLKVARRQVGGLRFCYVWPESRTPKRYRCQPDLVKAAIPESCSEKKEKDEQESTRVRPQFNSLRYGTPTYCQLADDCSDEITRGADDESEIGVFHDLFQPQRMANLRVRLDEYLPARMDIDIITAN